MVAYLSKSDASEGFNQIIDFLNGGSLKYALTVNDVTRLQALVDRKKVVVTEATIKNHSVWMMQRVWIVCLMNTFLQSWLEWDTRSHPPSSHFTKPSSRASGSDLSTHTTKYTSPALTQKVFANMRRVGKGFSGVGTPLFEGMLVEHEIDEEGAADEHVEEVDTSDAAQGDDSAARGEVPTVAEEQSMPSPTPPTPPPQPPQDIPSTSQHLEFDKVAQALEITKLKMRVRKLEKRNKVRVLKLRRLQKVGTSQRVETFDDIVMDDESNQGRMIAKIHQDDVVVLEDDKEEDKDVADAYKDVKKDKVDESAKDQARQAESQAEIYKIDMDHANKVLSMQEDETEPAKVQEVVDVVTIAKLIIEVITATSETVTAASAIITTAKA
nr:hypothetical protein [Tanacetum cinerariifolium]